MTGFPGWAQISYFNTGDTAFWLFVKSQSHKYFPETPLYCTYF